MNRGATTQPFVSSEVEKLGTAPGFSTSLETNGCLPVTEGRLTESAPLAPLVWF